MYDPVRGPGGEGVTLDDTEAAAGKLFAPLFLEKEGAIQPRRLVILQRGRDPTAQVGHPPERARSNRGGWSSSEEGTIQPRRLVVLRRGRDPTAEVGGVRGSCPNARHKCQVNGRCEEIVIQHTARTYVESPTPTGLCVLNNGYVLMKDQTLPYFSARPPSEVSRYLLKRSRPVSYIVETTRSKESFRV